jgi:tRNA A37 threonylcarbamoyladenosine synthetase subunit TsaC/SUA5/YrdC
VALDLLRIAGPLAVTSANRSVDRPVNSADDARDVFADEVLTYLPGGAGGGEPSTLVDLTQPSEMILRSGPIQL